jgi:hypothetical protein
MENAVKSAASGPGAPARGRAGACGELTDLGSKDLKGGGGDNARAARRVESDARKDDATVA